MNSVVRSAPIQPFESGREKDEGERRQDTRAVCTTQRPHLRLHARLDDVKRHREERADEAGRRAAKCILERRWRKPTEAIRS